MKKVACLISTITKSLLIPFAAVISIFLGCCKNRLEDWKTPDVPILQREVVRSDVMPRFACGSLEDTTSVANIEANGIILPETIEKTNFDTNIWVYSNLAVKRLAYSADMNMLFIVPATETSDGNLHFMRIRKLDFAGLKMTALDCVAPEKLDRD